MSGNIFIDCLLLFLICYALVCIFRQLSDFLIERYCKHQPAYVMVLVTEHESRTLERDIRHALFKSLSQGCVLVILADGLSLDENKLLWRLTDVYEHVILTTRDEFMNKLYITKSVSSLKV